jgi:hypothetical protein
LLVLSGLNTIGSSRAYLRTITAKSLRLGSERSLETV